MMQGMERLKEVKKIHFIGIKRLFLQMEKVWIGDLLLVKKNKKDIYWDPLVKRAWAISRNNLRPKLFPISLNHREDKIS